MSQNSSLSRVKGLKFVHPGSFCEIMPIVKPTDTNTIKCWQKHNVGGGNNNERVLCALCMIIWLMSAAHRITEHSKQIHVFYLLGALIVPLLGHRWGWRQRVWYLRDRAFHRVYVTAEQSWLNESVRISLARKDLQTGWRCVSHS